jgi:single-strand DNA-binding protein
MNKVVLIGRLTKDPELKFTPGSGTAVASFTIAVDKRVKNDTGEKQADFISIVVWGKTAEYVANYSAKGKLIGISGRIQTRSYDAKDGTKRYVTEVVAEEVQILEFARSSNSGSGNSNSNGFNMDGMTEIDDGIVPF